jgi:hypothetical protein
MTVTAGNAFCFCLFDCLVLRFKFSLTLGRQALYHLSHFTSPFFVGDIFEIGSFELFAWAGLEV